MRRAKIEENTVCHIFNRGVGKQRIFMDDSDYFRFVHDLWEFNDWAPSPNIFYRKKALDSYEVGLRKNYLGLADEKKGGLVEILAFSLMPNHFHLMLRQLVENGVTDFMRKLGTGYTNFFNKKYKRSGSLFGGIYKFVKLENHAQFLYLPYYIHLNPLDLKFSDWRKNKLKNINEAMKFLDSYRWSSHPDYCGQKNWPSVINKKFLQKIFGSDEKYKKDLIRWLEDIQTEKIANYILE